MMTIFVVPKPFRGHFDVIQRNAISSWLLLRPACEIILFGDEEGTVQVARELGVRHIAKVERNKYGTPLLHSLFGQAEEVASYGHLCYVNADIILLSDFLPAVQKVAAAWTRFLAVGRRWDLDVQEQLTFCPDWEDRLRSSLAPNGRLHAHTGIDYFVFPRGLWETILPFAIGRTAWDNWLIYRARSQKIPVIDLTETVTVIHQNHDYSHTAGGEAAVWKGPEAMQNLAIAGGYARLFTLADADYRLTKRGIQRKITPYYFYRRLVTLSASHRSAEWLLRLLRSSLGLWRPEGEPPVVD